ncbi:MAG TPA: NTP transferase domain-containing protein [Acidimicrobiales bacterium]
MTAAAVVLAAGAGARFTGSGGPGPKQLASVAGKALVELALEAARGAGLDEVVLVEGAVDLSGHAGGATLLRNPRWEEGLATSLQVALAHARAEGHDAVVVGPSDQPGVGADAWAAVAAAPPEPPIAVATYDGRRANPVRLHHTVWDLLPVTGDAGARTLINDRPDLVRELRCTGDPHDVDTMEDLERWS